MKLVLKILFILFLGAMVVGFVLKNNDNSNGEIVLGVGVIFMAFILMPTFIYYRYRNGKYKKYVLDSKKKNPFKLDKDQLI